MPLIEWNKDQPGVHTGNLQDYEIGVLSRCTLPFILYFGSDQGCGCGFRHALADGDGWLPVVADNKDDLETERKNHMGLSQFLVDHLMGESIEIYACWNGDVNDRSDYVSDITIEEIGSENFYFKEGWLYRMTV
jgi:hypothetical protein